MTRLLKIGAAVLVVLGIFVAGVIVGGHPAATGLDQLREGTLRSLLIGDSGRDLSEQVLDLLERSYYTPIDADALERRSVEGMLEALGDPYTYYLDADQLAELREGLAGAYGGVGITVTQRDETVVVTEVIEGGPADRAGIRRGDLLVSVEGTALVGGDLDLAIARIKGRAGTEVRLGVRRPGGQTRELTLRRARIMLPVVEARREMRSGVRIGYARLDQFTRGSGATLKREISELLDQQVKALVLDLRGDPGGLVEEAVKVASIFLPQGTPVVITEGAHSARTTLEAGAGAITPRLPLIVLVDRSSASASEIVAGALRDARRGTLIGTRTFGKALVQTTRVLENGGALKLTTARYLTPSGFDLGSRGLPPSVRIEDDPETPADEALERALTAAVAAAAARG